MRIASVHIKRKTPSSLLLSQLSYPPQFFMVPCMGFKLRPCMLAIHTIMKFCRHLLCDPIWNTPSKVCHPIAIFLENMTWPIWWSLLPRRLIGTIIEVRPPQQPCKHAKHAPHTLKFIWNQIWRIMWLIIIFKNKKPWRAPSSCSQVYKLVLEIQIKGYRLCIPTLTWFLEYLHP